MTVLFKKKKKAAKLVIHYQTQRFFLIPSLPPLVKMTFSSWEMVLLLTLQAVIWVWRTVAINPKRLGFILVLTRRSETWVKLISPWKLNGQTQGPCRVPKVVLCIFFERLENV